MDLKQEIKKVTVELLGGYLQFPNIWIKDLMRDEGRRREDGEGFYAAVSPSFWKFLTKLWHETMYVRDGKTRLSASLALREFGIRPNDACLWANAVVAGGLFSVEKGTFSSRARSTYFYNTAADSVTWQGFYRGLMMAYAEWRASREVSRMDKYDRMSVWADLVKIHVVRETEALVSQIGGGQGRIRIAGDTIREWSRSSPAEK